MSAPGNQSLRVLHWNEHPSYDIGDEKKMELVYKYNDKFFSVILSDRPLPGFDGLNLIGRQYLERIEDCACWEGGPEDEPEGAEDKANLLYEEIQDFLEPLCLAIFRELAPISSDQGRRRDLHSHLNPESITFQLETLHGEPTLVRCNVATSACTFPSLPETTPISSSIPKVVSSSIDIIEEGRYSWQLKVSVNDRTMFCKLGNPMGYQSLLREYLSLQKILDSGIASSIRVPSIQGVVQSPDGLTVGLLSDYIEPAIPNLEHCLLLDNTITKSRKEKWAKQIKATLEKLHSIGVIWGDAKSGNVLIDKNDDAWILDFGGGQTVGWIETKLVDTKEGDLQALDMILDALK